MKKVLKKIWDEFIYDGHLLGIGGVSILISFFLILNYKIDWCYLLIVYLGIILVYSHDRKHTSVSKKPIFIIIASLFLILLSYFVYGTAPLFAVILLLLLGLGYGLIFKNISKRVLAFKNFFVPLPYALLVLLYPVFINSKLNYCVILFTIFVYLRFFVAVSFYDIKDINEDKKEGMRTFAVLFTEKQLYLFLSLVNIISFSPLLVGIYLNYFRSYSLILLTLLLYSQMYFSLSKKSYSIHTLSYLFCDGEFVLWFPLVLAAKGIWR